MKQILNKDAMTSWKLLNILQFSNTEGEYVAPPALAAVPLMKEPPELIE